MPVSSSAMPMTMLNTATRSAKNDVLSAVVSAVSVTQMLRARFSTGRPATQTIPYEDLAGVRVGRSSSERIDGRPTVILERRTGLPLTLATVAQQTLLGEIVERLTALQLAARGGAHTVTVIRTRLDWARRRGGRSHVSLWRARATV
jgi:hypothetical protein